MKNFTTFLAWLFLPLALSAQTLPKGMTDLTAAFAQNDPGFALTVQDDRPSEKISVLTLNTSGTKMFFTAKTTANGNELWVTDGTAAGTQMVKDINTGSGNSDPSYLIMVGDNLYFSANDGTHGAELWVSDGTSANTNMVYDVFAGANSSSPTLLTNLNGKILFWAKDIVSSASGMKYMYIYDPATTTATQISTTQAIFSADNNYGMSVVLKAKNLAVFTSDPSTPVTGQEVWVTDGTASGTKMLKDVWPGPGGSGLQWVVNYNDSAVVWRENTPIGYAGADSVNYMTSLGEQMWASDGTPAGTHFLKHYNKAVTTTGTGTGTQFAWPIYFSSLNAMLFRADDGIHGVELGITNASTDTSQTHMLADINPGGDPSWPEDYTVYHDYICFDANAGGSNGGAQPRYLDGNTVKLMQNVYPGGSGWCRYLTTVQVAGKDSFLYSVGTNATSGNELFVSNGIGNEADLVVDLGPGNSNPNNLRSWHNALYFTSAAFQRLLKYEFVPVPQIVPATSLVFDDSNWNDTIKLVITKKNPESFITKVIKAEIMGTDSSFHISATRNGTYGFSCRTAGNDISDSIFVIAGKYLNPDSFVRNVPLSLSTPGVDTAVPYITSLVSPSFRYDKYYQVVCGYDKTDPIPGVALGKYNSKFDQDYALDPTTGKNWGFTGSAWNLNGTGLWGCEREGNDLVYKFDVENGDYIVWLGFHEFWNGRTEKVGLNNLDTITVVVNSGYQVIKKPVTVTDGKIQIGIARVQDNPYLNNITIGKVVAGSKCFDPICTLRDSLYQSTRISTNVRKLPNNQNISLFPNPTDGILMLNADMNAYKTYEVLDIIGRIVLSGKITGGTTLIDLGSLGNGLYFVKAQGADVLCVQKFLIKR
jgi:ELWxxDGT repeat protein